MHPAQQNRLLNSSPVPGARAPPSLCSPRTLTRTHPQVDELGKDDTDEAAEYQRAHSGLSSGRQSGSGKAKGAGTEPEDAVLEVPEGSMQVRAMWVGLRVGSGCRWVREFRGLACCKDVKHVSRA